MPTQTSDPAHDPTQPRDPRSLGEIVSDISTDLTTLIKQEMDLAKVELKQEVAQAGKGAGMLGGAGVAGHLVLVFLSLAMTFLLPLELAGPEVRPGLEMAEKGARASGTPFLSFFTPREILALAREAGFGEARHVPAADLARRYFTGRTDDLRPPDNAEELLVANT